MRPAVYRCAFSLVVVFRFKSVGNLRSRIVTSEQTKSLVCEASAPNAIGDRWDFYDDLYFTEQPYGLVCGVETDLPSSD
jgi:hypothetical protein